MMIVARRFSERGKKAKKMQIQKFYHGNDCDVYENTVHPFNDQSED